jgi:anti-sigma regulatory factor (Ser/Thr protein kinase)
MARMERNLSVPGRFDRLEQVSHLVAEAAKEAGFNEADVNRCQLAVDEACTNIIEHGYGGEDKGKIEIACVFQPGELTITIRDQAKPFDPNGVPPPKLSTTIENLRAGGLGLYFMRQIMDQVEFSYEDGGNKLILVKRK